MSNEQKKSNYDLELTPNGACKEQDQSTHSFIGKELGEAIKSDARQMLEQSNFQEALVLFARTGPTRPVVLWIGLERIFRRGRVKRGPGKGRMRTLRRYDQYKDPKQAESLKKMLEPRPGDFSGCSITPPNARDAGLDALFSTIKGTHNESENL